MKGYATSNSPYARKVRIAAMETGQPDLIDWTMMTREERAAQVPAVNPLGKVPAVLMTDGSALYDSPVLVEWVDSLHAGQKLIPQSGPERWKALTLAALGDGLGEAVIAVSLEGAKPDHPRRSSTARAARRKPRWPRSTPSAVRSTTRRKSAKSR